MAGLLEIGRSAIHAQREALNVTGQNIINVNTEGYRRRDASLKEVSGIQSELTALTAQTGLGVRLGEVRRAYDSFLTETKRSATSKFESSDAFVKKLEQLENTILPNDGDLGVTLTAFFDRLGQVAAKPGDFAPRAAAIEMGHTVANSFNTTAMMLTDLSAGTFNEIETRLAEADQNIEALGKLNGQLRSSNRGINQPNSLLDERDRLIDELSEILPINVTIGPRNDAELRLGHSLAGPIILSGEDAKQLSAIMTDQGAVAVRIGTGQIVSQLEAGGLRGLVDAHGTTQRALGELDTLARKFSSEMNEQHGQGVDLDGDLGRELFSTAQFSPVISALNKGSAEVSISLVPGRANLLSEMELAFDESSDRWILKDNEGETLGRGRNRIEIDGAVIEISGRGEDGDKVELIREAGDAARIGFLLQRPEEIAAASTVTIHPEMSNMGNAVLTTTRTERTASGVPALTDTLVNNLSPVIAQDFLRSGVVGTIPRGTQEITLASFATQTTASVFAQDGGDISSISVTLDDVAHSFNFDPQIVGLQSWESAEEIAQHLNSGSLKNSGGQSIADLGLSVTGSQNGLVFASDGSRVLSDFSASSVQGTSLNTEVVSGQPASDIRIFTREGRQISGTPLLADDVSQLLTVENGFSVEAEYRADYNTVTNGVGYRGVGIVQSRTSLDPMEGGMNIVSTSLSGLRGSNAGTISPDSRVNETQAQTMTLEMGTGTIRSFSVPPSVDAAYVAQIANETFASVGVQANAMTAVRLDLETGLDGSIQFDLTGRNGEALTVSAFISNGDLTGLVDAVNLRTTDTGVGAELSSSRNSITLIQDAGFDIGFSNIETRDVSFSAASLDQNYQALALDNGINPAMSTSFEDDMRVSGTVQFKSNAEFDLTSTRAGEETHVLTSDRNPLVGGMVARSFSDGGSSAALRYNVEPKIDGEAASVDGSRVHAPSARFETELRMPDGTLFRADVKGASFPSMGQIAQSTANQLRSDAPIPALRGGPMVLENVPEIGSKAKFKLGGAEYTLERVDDGDPSRLSQLDFRITGPEEGRIVPRLIEENGTYALSLEVVGGQLSGAGPIAISDSTARQFGLGASQSKMSVQGRAIEPNLADGVYRLDVGLAGVEHEISVAVEDGVYTVGIPEASEGLIAAQIVVSPTGQNALVLSAGQPQMGPISIGPNEEAAQLGFKVGAVDLNVQNGILNARSTKGAAVDIVAGGVSAASSYIHLTDIPDEELIVTIGGQGAKRLAAEFVKGPAVAEGDRTSERFRVEMIDAETGRVELFDRESGASIATRTTSGITHFSVSGQNIEMSGFAETGDSFDVATGQRAPGDSRNMETLASFGQNLDGMKSFQDDFRTIAAGVGATLEAARLTNLSNEAVYEAAAAAESELSGVNLDDEAAQLMSQQQAYQAAARILQTARELFDTLLQIT
jgi:flagellar hook-associated protein 1 FlgK